jgi:hypothetical protein
MHVDVLDKYSELRMIMMVSRVAFCPLAGWLISVNLLKVAEAAQVGGITRSMSNMFNGLKISDTAIYTALIPKS